MRETIVAAAIRIPVPREFCEQEWVCRKLYPDFLTVSAPPPARHYSLLHPLPEDIVKTLGPDDQGFITSAGRFVGRREALEIVLTADQPQIDHPSKNAGGQLFSEDLW